MPAVIREMQNRDWPAVRIIYQEGIESGLATFETHVPSWAEWDWNHLRNCRYVAVRQNAIVGWAALSLVSRRQVYAGVAEVSIYVASSVQRQGVGGALLQTLIYGSEQAGFRTLQATIFAENKASIVLHNSCDFRLVGYREQIGQREGVWHNTVLLERRAQSR